MTYATDSDLTTRIPDTSAVSLALRTVALDDAEAEISDAMFGQNTLRAHVNLAAHYLAMDGLISGGSGGPVASRSAGEASVSYAVTALGEGDSQYATTKYGREFIRIRRYVPAPPISL